MSFPAVKWGHPLVRGMIDCVVMYDGVPVNLTSNYDVVFIGSPLLQNTPDGPSVYTNNAANGFYIPNHANYVAADGAVRLRFMPISWPAAYTRLFNKGNGGGAAGQDEIAVFFATNGSINWLIWGGGGGVTLGSFAVKQVHDIVLSKSGTTLTVFQDGVSLGTATSGTTIANYNFNFGYGPTNPNPNCHYLTFQSWNRALTQTEISQLYIDPYCFLMTPAEYEMSAILAPGPSFLSAWATQSNLPVIGAGTY